MRRWRAALLLALAVAAVGVVTSAWLLGVPDISAGDAVTTTEAAFADAGLEVSVDPMATRRSYLSPRRSAVEVWAVRATVRDTAVDVLLARSGAQPVAIDDRTPDGADHVLTDAEYQAVAGHIEDLSLARSVRRNVALTMAAGLVVALCLALATTTPLRKDAA